MLEAMIWNDMICDVLRRCTQGMLARMNAEDLKGPRGGAG